MTEIIITEKAVNEENVLLIQTLIEDLLSSSGSVFKFSSDGERARLTISCMEYFTDLIRQEIVDKVAELITIKYKYELFKKSIEITGLSSIEKELLYTSIIAADLEDDKRYVIDKIKDEREFAIDGIYSFRISALKKKWQDVIGYIPSVFLQSQLKDFVSYLLENKKRRIFVDNGIVYDSHYRRLKRALLLDGDKIKIIREALLSNCGVVEISGEIPKDDEYYLKEFYSDKIIFSR